MIKLQSSGKLYIDGGWEEGHGIHFSSFNPATLMTIWQGNYADTEQINRAITSAHQAWVYWSGLEFHARQEYIERFKQILQEHKEELSIAISEEVGKPLWESHEEVQSVINKCAISIDSYQARCPETVKVIQDSTIHTRHMSHGVAAVFGPFNFPAHLPHGHIIPALLAGNSIIFKPSELTPYTAELLCKYWEIAELPRGVLSLLHGAKEVGETLVNHSAIRGIFFTGSVQVGQIIGHKSLDYPGRIVALEMGGNNPLIVSSYDDIATCAYTIIHSAFVTTGQRCSCARRLILIENETTDALIAKLIDLTQSIRIGSYTDNPEPYMGPLISPQAAQSFQEKIYVLQKQGGKLLTKEQQKHNSSFVLPAIIDMSEGKAQDEEIFGPLLQVFRVRTLDDAIARANDTRFGLSCSVITQFEEEYRKVLYQVRAGVINWNAPTTGASSWAPFGGIGISGNHRPSAYYAADYTAYPVASIENSTLKNPSIHLTSSKP